MLETWRGAAMDSSMRHTDLVPREPGPIITELVDRGMVRLEDAGASQRAVLTELGWAALSES